MRNVGKRIVRVAIGAAAVVAVGAAKVLLKGGLGVAVGAAVGAGATYLTKSPDGRNVRRGMASVTNDVDALLTPYTDSSEGFYARLSAMAIPLYLEPSELREVLTLRRAIAVQIPAVDCARLYWDGEQAVEVARAATNTLSTDQKARLGFLAGRAAALHLTGAKRARLAPLPDGWAVALGTPDELQVMEAGFDSTAAPEVKCKAAVAMWDLTLRQNPHKPMAQTLFRVMLGAEEEAGK